MRNVLPALTVGLLSAFLFSAAASAANVVYDTTGSTDAIDQQVGNNYYYIGDTAVPVGTGTLNTVGITFGSTYYSGTHTAGTAFTYTPNLTLDLYPTAANALTHTGLIGTAQVNNVTFANDGNLTDANYDYNYENEQLVTFDFSSQNIALPATFAFAVHDTPPVGSSIDGQNGLSVGLTTALASVGVSDQNYFDTYPNSASDPTETLIPNGGYNVEAQVTVTPEPASLGLLGMGAVALLAKRRRRSA